MPHQNVNHCPYVQPVQSQPHSNKTLEAPGPNMFKANIKVVSPLESSKPRPDTRVLVQGREAVLVRVGKDGKEYYRFADALK